VRSFFDPEEYMHNRFPIAQESLCYRCGIAVELVRDRIAIAGSGITARSMRNLCRIATGSMRIRFAIAMESLRIRYAIDVKSLWNRCGIVAQSLCNRCEMALRSL
jgi:hypothetical protein